MQKCPRCGVEASYISKCDRYYCYNCQKYLDSGIPAPLDPQNFSEITDEPESDKESRKESWIDTEIKKSSYLGPGIKKDVMFNWPLFAIIAVLLISSIALLIVAQLPQEISVDKSFMSSGLLFLILGAITAIFILTWVAYIIHKLIKRKRKKHF